MNDTIVSISTALGKGAISIVRLSGKDAINIVNNHFKGKDLTKVESHTINYGYITYLKNTIDEVLVMVMKGPKTYTMEDIVEINCHGGIATTNKILEVMVLGGARLATKGEFTKRAFLNGRIDLVEAEATADLIDSKTDEARKLAISNITGRLTNLIRSFRQDLLELLANIEVNIDYPEYEDIEVVTIELIASKISEMKEKIIKIIEESLFKKIIKEGINVAIVGKPNVGKSSILNKLIGEDKAIVTNIAGTTRDVVEGSVNINGVAFNFFDTAGIRETKDEVERVGVIKSEKQIDSSDLIILVFDNNSKLTREDLEILTKIKNKKHIIVVNKKDLKSNIDIENLPKDNIVYTDTFSLDGIEELKNKLKELFNLEQLDQKNDEVFANMRQITIAKETVIYLENIIKGIEEEIPVDMLGIDIKKIWAKLGEILGENYDEELIDQLFNQFCLGK